MATHLRARGARHRTRRARMQDSATLNAGIGIGSSKDAIASAGADVGACAANRASDRGPFAPGSRPVLLPSLANCTTAITEEQEEAEEATGAGAIARAGRRARMHGHRCAREPGHQSSGSYGDAQQTGLASHTSFASLSSDDSSW
jgi:hypothetical protein